MTGILEVNTNIRYLYHRSLAIDVTLTLRIFIKEFAKASSVTVLCD